MNQASLTATCVGKDGSWLGATPRVIDKYTNGHSNKTVFHTASCVECGVDWCANLERDTADVEQYYNRVGGSAAFQTRGCSGVDASWIGARNSVSGDVYAVAPWDWSQPISVLLADVAPACVSDYHASEPPRTCSCTRTTACRHPTACILAAVG